MFELRVGIQRRRADWPQVLEAVDRIMIAMPTLPQAQSMAAVQYSAALQDRDALRPRTAPYA
jgi:hypothetical protein